MHDARLTEKDRQKIKMNIYSSISNIEKFFIKNQKNLSFNPSLQIMLADLIMLSESLRMLDAMEWHPLIAIFNTIPGRLSPYCQPRKLIPPEEITIILITLEELKIKLSAGLRTHRVAGTATTFTKKDLLELLNSALHCKPNLDRTIMDWQRGDFFSINTHSFMSYIADIPAEVCVKVITNFCSDNRLTQEQTSFILCQTNQHVIGGLLAYPMEPFRNALANQEIEFSPSWENGTQVLVNTADNSLSIQCQGILIAKSNFNSSEIHRLASLCLMVTVSPGTQWIERMDDKIGRYFLPEFATIKLQFAIIDRGIDPMGLKRLLASTLICEKSTVATIEQRLLLSEEILSDSTV